MERPVEPYSTQEDPEQWAAIATYETERADRMEKALLGLTVEEFDGLLRSADKGYWTSTMLAQSIRELMLRRLDGAS